MLRLRQNGYRHGCGRRLRVFAALLLVLLTAGPLGAAAAESSAALVLYSYDDTLPWQRLLRKGLQDELLQIPVGSRPAVYEERLDGQRLGYDKATEGLGAHLARKYAGVRIGTVVTESVFAARFLRDHPELFPGARRYYLNHSMTERVPQDGIAIHVGEDFATAVATMRDVMPRLRRAVVVADKSPATQARQAALSAALQAQQDWLATEIWDDFTYPELFERAGRLGADTAIFYLATFRDKTGAASAPAETVRTLAARASVPVFVHYDSQMSPGIVGGFMLSAERLGRLAAGLLLGRFGADAGEAQALGRQAYSHIFDYPSFERFGLAAAGLPAGAAMLNRPPSLWETYRWQIIAATVVFVVQSALVLALLATLRGRNRALVALGEERQRVAHHAAELERHKEHLEELVRERTLELETALARAEAASRAKSTFLANMSHELRTPLTAVIGFSQLMADDPTTAEAQQHNLSIINRSGQHLLTLINDVLTLSKIEAGRQMLAEQAADPAELAGEVVEMMRVRAWGKGLSLTLNTQELPAAITIDSAKLRQVLLNLLSNAVKFTERGAIILTVAGTPAADGKTRLDFRVCDTGCGVPLADQERIFEPFVQAEGGAAQGGTGLGLAISREFVRLMGGELTIESTPGHGATFRFSLLVDNASAQATRPCDAGQVVAVEGVIGRRILLVDDNPDIRLLLRSLLSRLGFLVDEAHQGEAALAAVVKFQPELVLMDWRMPGRDGIETTQRIRALKGIRQPKIAMLTASAFEEDRHVAIAAGADDFLRKPFHPDTLLDLLERHLGARFRREAVERASTPSTTIALSTEDLGTLPAAARTALAEAVHELNAAKLGDTIAAIGREHPDIAARIRTLAEAAQYRQLFEMLEACGDA